MGYGYRRSFSNNRAKPNTTASELSESLSTSANEANSEDENGSDKTGTTSVTASATFRQAILDLFSTTNSILVGKKVRCAVSSASPVACTNGEDVFFNKTLLDLVRVGNNEDERIRSLAHVIGVNYHEVAHILFSPRTTGKLYREVKQLPNPFLQGTHSRYGRSWSEIPLRVLNLLEDQRIESLFAGKYVNSVPYFRSSITRLIINETSVAHRFHLWLHGRKYIPSDIRAQARELFQAHYGVSDDDLAKWDGLVDEFRKLVFPRGTNRAVQIVKEYLELSSKYNIEDFSAPNHDEHEHQKGSPSNTSEQEEAQEASEELDERLEQAEEDKQAEGNSTATSEPDDNADDADDSSSSNDGEDEGEDSNVDGNSSNGDGNGASTDASGDGQDIDNSHNTSDSTGKTDAPSKSDSSGSGASAGNGKGEGDNSGTSSLIDSLDDLLSESTDTTYSESSKILGQVRSKVESLALDSVFSSVEKPSKSVPAPIHYTAVYNAINKSLQQLRADADSSWERGTRQGRLNTKLVLQSDIRDADIPVFDSWHDDLDDAPSVEVVILLDQSSSMNGHTPTAGGEIQSLIDEASASLWAIKRACQTNGLPCTVIGYSDAEQTSVLYKASDKVHPNQVGLFNYKRSTEPRVALAIAKTIFERSEARHKILFSLSDGAWIGQYEEISLVNAINNLGVHTVFVALPCGYNYKSESASDGSFSYRAVPVHSFDESDKNLKRIAKSYISHGRSCEYSAYGYNHKTVLLVGNSTDLAKKLGKVIVSATASVQ